MAPRRRDNPTRETGGCQVHASPPPNEKHMTRPNGIARLAVVSLLIGSLSGVGFCAPELDDAVAGRAVSTPVAKCCCGSATGACCGKTCCSASPQQQELPLGPQTPKPRRVELGSTVPSGRLDEFVSPGRCPAAQCPHDRALASLPTLQGEQVRIQV